MWGDDRRTPPQGKHQVYGARIRDDGAIVDPNGIAIDTRTAGGPRGRRPYEIADAEF